MNVGSFKHFSQHLQNFLAEVLGEMLYRLKRPLDIQFLFVEV